MLGKYDVSGKNGVPSDCKDFAITDVENKSIFSKFKNVISSVSNRVAQPFSRKPSEHIANIDDADSLGFQRFNLLKPEKMFAADRASALPVAADETAPPRVVDTRQAARQNVSRAIAKKFKRFVAKLEGVFSRDRLASKLRGENGKPVMSDAQKTENDRDSLRAVRDVDAPKSRAGKVKASKPKQDASTETSFSVADNALPRGRVASGPSGAVGDAITRAQNDAAARARDIDDVLLEVQRGLNRIYGNSESEQSEQSKLDREEFKALTARGSALRLRMAKGDVVPANALKDLLIDVAEMRFYIFGLSWAMAPRGMSDASKDRDARLDERGKLIYESAEKCLKGGLKSDELSALMKQMSKYEAWCFESNKDEKKALGESTGESSKTGASAKEPRLPRDKVEVCVTDGAKRLSETVPTHPPFPVSQTDIWLQEYSSRRGGYPDDSATFNVRPGTTFDDWLQSEDGKNTTREVEQMPDEERLHFR